MKKVANIVEDIHNFNERQNGNRNEISPFKQMLQKLPKALAQVKVGNTSDSLLKSDKSCICIEKKKLLKKNLTT